MPEQELTLAREMYDAWNRGNAKWVTKNMTADAEVRPLRDFDDFDEVYEGREGWRAFARAWRSRWSGVEIRVERMEDLGEHGVLVLLTLEGVEKNGDEKVSMAVSHWLTFDDGLLSGLKVMPPETAERRREPRD